VPSNQHAPHILERVAGLTSIRDADLLDVSMIRTLFDLLTPERVGLFRMEANRCRDAGLFASRVDANVAFADVGEALAVRARMANGGRLRWVEHVEGRDSHRALFPVAELRMTTTYLYVESFHADALDDTRLVDAFLRFYGNYCSLLDYSQRDQLTGLLNRRTFNDCMLRLMGSRSRPITDDSAAAEAEGGTRRRASVSNWLAMLDLDHFKRVNDVFGHLFGDEVLLVASQIIKRSFRETDLLFRFGGEEFVVIARDTDRGGALTAFENLRRNIAAHQFPQLGTISVSIGVVELGDRQDAMTLLDRADRALYFAKQNGRDQVALYEDLIEKSLIDESRAKVGEIELF
jgi:diguanylate cyclase (GGDEF)-like protein